MILMAVLICCGTAFASNSRENRHNDPRLSEPRRGRDHTHDKKNAHNNRKGRSHYGHGNGHHKDAPASVPELDKAVGASVAVLIGGGLMVILGRRRKA